MDTEARSTPSAWNCFSHTTPTRIKKMRTMQPSKHAGSTVGTLRNGNRKGAKKRGMKAGRQRQAKVNVAALVAKTNKKSAA